MSLLDFLQENDRVKKTWENWKLNLNTRLWLCQRHKWGAIEQNKPFGCTWFSVKVCNLHQKVHHAEADYTLSHSTPKRLVLLDGSTCILSLECWLSFQNMLNLALFDLKHSWHLLLFCKLIKKKLCWFVLVLISCL